MKLFRLFLGLIALLCLPLCWAAFNISGIRITIKEFYQEWRTHALSGESWGMFDE